MEESNQGSHHYFEEDLAPDRDLELEEDRERAKLAAALTPDGRCGRGALRERDLARDSSEEESTEASRFRAAENSDMETSCGLTKDPSPEEEPLAGSVAG